MVTKADKEENVVDADDLVEDEDTTADTETEDENNPLEMDDEAFDALMAQGFDDDKANVEKEEDTAETETTEEDAETETTDKEEVDEEEKADTDEAETDEEESDSKESESATSDEATDDDDPTSDKDKEVEKILEDSERLKKIFSPFKANGKDMTVDNEDDVITLMQMGANYNKKMAALKPSLKLLKMLENNDLLDEGKISYLIDLDKKNPGAVVKLLKDSKINTEELDTEAEDSYKPSTYTVNDKEVELDDTLNEIRDTPSYAQTLTIITNKWDESSKASLLENPAGIKVLNDHVGRGIYDKVVAVVESERMFGRIPQGLNDLEAYKYIGEKLNASGSFNDPGTTATKKIVSKTATKAVDPNRDKKKAASSTKSTSSSKAKEVYNPLSMPDSEFEKMSMDKFI